MVKLKRAYEPSNTKDGYRILVDRLWPRGLKKEIGHIDFWAKDIAPSPALRKWFNHEPGKWAAFSKTYREELNRSTVIDEFIELIKKEKKVTLLYAAKDEQYTHALVLLHFINELL